MIDPEIGEKVIIDKVTYERAEPQNPGWMWEECDLFRMRRRCIFCPIECNAYYRKDGKHIILKRTSK